jgi:hypothetical protein
VSEQGYYQFLFEKWTAEKKEKMKDYSEQTKKYLVEQELNDIVLMFDLLAGYCLNPEDESKHSKFLRYINAFHKEYKEYTELVEIFSKDRTLKIFLLEAFLSFKDEKGMSTYPGREIVKQQLQRIVETIGAYKQKLLGILEEKPAAAPDRPAYIQRMIDKGLLYPDGVRVLKNLVNVISYLEQDERIEVTSKYLVETFKKKNGKDFTERTARRCLETAHTR